MAKNFPKNNNKHQIQDLRNSENTKQDNVLFFVCLFVLILHLEKEYQINF